MPTSIDAIIFLGFLIANIILGLASSQGIKSLKEYAVGNRDFSTATIAATIVATWIGGSFFFTLSSEAYNNGLHFIWVVLLGDFSCLLLVGLFFTPRMAEFLGKLSIAEAMGDLYGEKVRIVTAIAGFIGTCGIIAMQLRVAGIVFEYVLELPGIYGIISAGIIVTLYSSLGGIKSVTFTDVIQFFTFGTVIPAIAYFLLSSLDSIFTITEVLSNNPLFDYKQVFDFSKKQPLYHLFLFFCFAIPAFNPAIFQRIAMAKTTTQAGKSFVIAAFTCLFLVAIISSIGILTLISNPNINPNDVVKYIILNPSFVIGFKGLILAGIMAMIMSTIDSYINCTAILIVHDFLKPLRIKLIVNELFSARIVSVIIGIVSILLSLRNSSLLDLALSAYASYMPIVTPPFIMAILGFRSTGKSVLLGMTAGLLTVLTWNILEIKIVDSVPPSMLLNFIFLMGSHYILKQQGGWVGIKDNISLLNIRTQRKLKFQHFIKEIKSFDPLHICKNNYPKGEGLISIFGLFVMIVTFSSVNTLSKSLHTHYSYLLDILYPLTLCSSTALISYPLWLPSWKVTNLIGIIWNIITFLVLICFSCLMVFISNFSEIQLMIFLVNIIVISSLVRWQWALFTMTLGVAIVTFCYTHYIAVDLTYNNLLVSQFKIIYLLLLISSSLVLFLKPKQNHYELTKQKTNYLEHQIYDQEIELQKLIALRNELLGNINHELHTPITGITSLGQILDERYDKFSEKKRREVIKDIANSSTKLQLLIDNIFDLSKVSALNYQLNKTQTNLSNLVYDCFDRCRKIYQTDVKDQEFILNVQDDVITICDEHYIKQTVDNLIANAIKYCKEGKIIISLAKKELIQLSISDEGIGIPLEEIYDIFGAFIVSSKTKTPAGGRGIGLALCKKAIEAHGGTIWVEQNPNKGVTFKFTI